MSGTASRGARIALQAVIALVVTIAALWWVFHDADLDAMAESLGKASPWAVLAFGAGQLFIHSFRVIRWGLYIRPLGPDISNRAIFAAANIGIAGTFLIPLRLGELLRPALIQRSGVPFASGVASVFVERIADGLCAVGMFFIFFSFVPDSAPIPDELTQLSTGAAVAFGGGLVFLFAAAWARGPVLGAARAILSRISVTLADRIVGLVEAFLDGLAALGSVSRAAAFIGLTIAYWGGSGILIWLLAVSWQPDLPVVSGLFTVAVLVFAVMIPAGPAF
ncbi:MAG: lysylphosphatidylglycerol synthase transmembrane domain-containing protein, partial [Myxococcota bacterium]